MKIERFEDIQAWIAARDLTNRVYALSRRGEFGRDFGLRDQIRRAAVSVMANIAEGFDCDTPREFARFLGYARRSATEVQSHGYIALDAGYISKTEFEQIHGRARDAKGLIGGFVKYLRSVPPNKPRAKNVAGPRE